MARPLKCYLRPAPDAATFCAGACARVMCTFELRVVAMGKERQREGERGRCRVRRAHEDAAMAALRVGLGYIISSFNILLCVLLCLAALSYSCHDAG